MTQINENGMVDLTIKSYDEHAEEYTRFHFDRLNVKRLESFIELLSGKDLALDAGCGCGRDTKYLMEHGIKTIGIDLSKRTIEVARRYVSNASFLVMDMRKLNFEDETFCGILAMASIFHIPKKQLPNLFTEFNRVLKDRGLLYFCVMKGKGEKIVEKSAAVENMGPRFYAFYETEELNDLLQKAGFKLVHSFIDQDLGVDWLNIYARK